MFIYLYICEHRRYITAIRYKRMSICSRCEKTRLYARFRTSGLCAKCTKLVSGATRSAPPLSTCPICFELCGAPGTCTACTARAKSIKAQRPELVVKSFLKTFTGVCVYNNVTWPAIVHNRTDPLTKTSCTARRADIRLDWGYFQTIVEIDEDQHRRHSESCELHRLLEIVNAAGGIPIFVFRYNPDSFKRNAKPAHVTQTKRLALLRERIERRVVTVLRRITNDRSRTKGLVLPLLYVEYLFFDRDSDIGDDVVIRSYVDDKQITRAIMKCV